MCERTLEKKSFIDGKSVREIEREYRSERKNEKVIEREQKRANGMKREREYE